MSSNYNHWKIEEKLCRVVNHDLEAMRVQHKKDLRNTHKALTALEERIGKEPLLKYERAYLLAVSIADNKETLKELQNNMSTEKFAECQQAYEIIEENKILQEEYDEIKSIKNAEFSKQYSEAYHLKNELDILKETYVIPQGFTFKPKDVKIFSQTDEDGKTSVIITFPGMKEGDPKHLQDTFIEVKELLSRERLEPEHREGCHFSGHSGHIKVPHITFNYMNMKSFDEMLDRMSKRQAKPKPKPKALDSFQEQQELPKPETSQPPKNGMVFHEPGAQVFIGDASGNNSENTIVSTMPRR